MNQNHYYAEYHMRDKQREMLRIAQQERLARQVNNRQPRGYFNGLRQLIVSAIARRPAARAGVHAPQVGRMAEGGC